MEKGFTMIELLVSIGIIAVLSAISLSIFDTPRSSSRDARIVEDINQITRALELYQLDHSRYPGGNEIDTGAGSFSTLVLENYLSGVSTHPLGDQSYQYQGLINKNGVACSVGAECLYYHVGAKLQNRTSPALKNDADKNFPGSGIDGISGLSNCADDLGSDIAADLCYDITP